MTTSRTASAPRTAHPPRGRWTEALLIAAGLLLGTATLSYAQAPATAYASRGVAPAAPSLLDLKLSQSNVERISRPVTVRLTGASLKEALLEVAAAADLQLIFREQVLRERDRPITLDVDRVTALQAFHEVIRGTGLTLHLTPSGRLVVSAGAVPEGAAPDVVRTVVLHAVAGLVTSLDDGTPLPGVNVQVKGTTIGTATDLDGRYLLEAPGLNDTLVFSFVGFIPEEVPIAGRSEIDVELREDAVALEEVIVVGYGETRRRDLTGSVGSVRPEKLERAPVVNVAQGMQGRIAGVQVQQATGVPGSTPVIRIRGGNSLQGNNNPLYVVDGVIGAYGATEIHPSEIASIDVLKDASATAIYGARGANGVILITTKRGAISRPTVTWQSYYGAQEVIDPLDYVSGPEYARLLNDRARLAGEDLPYADPDAVPDFDWRAAITQTAPQQNHYAAVSGGADAFRYRISGEYLSQDGIITNTGYERVQLRSNFDADITSWASTGLSLTIHRTVRDEIEQPRNRDNPFFMAYNTPPVVTPFNDDGSYNYELIPTEPGTEMGNPLERINEERHNLRYHTGNLQAYLQAEPVRGLTYRLNASYSLANGLNQDFIPSTTFLGRADGGVGSQWRSESTTWLLENTLRYQRDLGAHSVGVLGGFTAQADEFQRIDAGNVAFLSDLFQYYNLGAGSADRRSIGSGFGMHRLVSVPLRLTYDYADRYLLTLNARADGSSRFGRNNKWAFFPSAALGWVISDEPFLRGQEALDLLKLRVSYGLTGSEAINSFQTLSLYGPRGGFVGQDQFITFFRQLRLPSPDLRWETTEQFNAGLEATTLNSRLNVVVDVYSKTTRDLLLNRSIPSLTGFTSVIDNIGSLRNRGVELTLNLSPIVRRDVGLDFDLTLGANRNEVLDLGEVDSLIVQAGVGFAKETRDALILKPGLPVGSFRVYQSCGVFQTQAEADAVPSVDAAGPGWQCLVDSNGDGLISDLDRVIVGDAEPDFSFGFNTALRVKQFDLAMFWQGNVGGQVYNINRFTNRNVLSDFYASYWRGEGTSATTPSPYSNQYITTDLVESGTYARLRQLTVSYRLPVRLTGRYGVDAARLYATGQNLLTLTNYSGGNPEANTYGGSNTNLNNDFAAYPLNRIYTVGVSLTM